MKNKISKNVLLALICFVGVISVQAQTWISLDGNTRSPQNYDVQVTEVPTGLLLEVSIPGLIETQVTIDGETYKKVNIPGASTLMESGKPQLPSITKVIEIPVGAQIQTEIQNLEEQTLTGYKILPYQLTYDLPEDQPFQIDEALYASNEFFPYKDIVLGEEMKMRGHSLVAVTINPVRYNPVTSTLKSLKKFSVLIQYTEMDVSIDENIFSPIFESMITGTVLNPKKTNVNKNTLSDAESGAEYLIITHDDFYNPDNPAGSPIQRFADHKSQKGLTVKIVRLSEINSTPTAENIQAFIQQAYNTWTQAPVYLLLVGDGEQIPVFNDNIDTDLYYGTVDGSDFIPDIFVGRFPAKTMNEATILVDKAINYENDNKTAPWKRRILTAAYFQDDEPDGIGNRGYLETAEEARAFVAGKGYDVRPVYTDSRDAWPTHSIVPTTYNNGNPIPSTLQFTGSAQATQDIIDIINEGVVIAAHRDHGSTAGWWQPEFEIPEISSLDNSNKLPLVFGINCQSGRYADLDGFGEVMVESPNKGAIGYIGASVNSPTFSNHIFYAGLFDCIFPEFKPNSTFGTAGSKKMGVIMVYGKMHLFGQNGSSSLNMFEMYNLQGDPELDIKLEVDKLTGDVNGDLSVNIVDALMTAQYYVGLDPQPFNENVADVNADGEINIVDALMIAQYYVGSITKFPSDEVVFNGMDLGSPAISGSFITENESIILTGAGRDIWSDSDEGYMVNMEKNGNFTLTAIIHSLDPTNDFAKAGIMVRSSMDPQSKNVFIGVTAAKGVTFQRRMEDGGTTVSTKFVGIQAPVWVRLNRESDTFTGAYSSDGVIWTTFNSINLPLGDVVHAGPAVTSHNVNVITTAEFELIDF